MKSLIIALKFKEGNQLSIILQMDYENEFIHDMVLIDPTKCIYQLAFYKEDIYNTYILQLFWFVYYNYTSK